MSLSTIDFDFIRALVRDRSAISLEEGKAYLAEARLAPLARREGFASLETLIARVRSERDDPGELRRRVVEAMTTNESSFFRDVHPYEALRKALIPGLIAGRSASRRLRVWCAACSSGQEPYSVALTLREHFAGALEGWDVTILATDLSTEVLEKAREGRYTQMEVNRGVPAPLLLKAFRKQGPEWFLKDEVRRMVRFERLNLIEPWPRLGAFDLVMLRNVLIYFEPDAKRRILDRVAGVLAPDGHLLLGTAETTLNLSDAYDRVEVERDHLLPPPGPPGPDAMNAPPEDPMRPFENELNGLVGEIWSAMLGLDARPDDRAVALAARGDAVVSRVDITGTWRGTVSLHCEPGLARDLAATMFGTSPEATSADLIEDALGELANMTSGSFKSLLPEPCFLSLPTAGRGGASPPGGDAPGLGRYGYGCLDGTFLVTVDPAGPDRPGGGDFA